MNALTNDTGRDSNYTDISDTQVIFLGFFFFFVNPIEMLIISSSSSWIILCYHQYRFVGPTCVFEVH